MTPAYDDHGELAEAIRKARRYAEMSQDKLAEELGKSGGTIKRWEAGDEASLGKTPEARRAVAILVAEVTRAPRSWLGLTDREEGAMEERVAGLEDRLDALLEVLQAGDSETAKRLRSVGDAVVQRTRTNSQSSQERGNAARNG